MFTHFNTNCTLDTLKHQPFTESVSRQTLPVLLHVSVKVFTYFQLQSVTETIQLLTLEAKEGKSHIIKANSPLETEEMLRHEHLEHYWLLI